ncbi:(deoxy)nucleoside triphosphate pyrophosphohydrolase [Eubacteriales bacterium OttesenSCG-928-A19]|nr:(deoxy)nucleoside triphosphate pyrophosphohydrolase [Eubacteriales bacterium OttesenSCG-928-A19]
MINVSAAVIIHGNRVLVCRRADGRYAGLWEFPGGKREPGETAAACVARECREELGIAIDAGSLLAAYAWEDSIHFSFFLATLREGTPECLDHSEVRWVDADALQALTFCPADTLLLDRVAGHLRTS